MQCYVKKFFQVVLGIQQIVSCKWKDQIVEIHIWSQRVLQKNRM